MGNVLGAYQEAFIDIVCVIYYIQGDVTLAELSSVDFICR